MNIEKYNCKYTIIYYQIKMSNLNILNAILIYTHPISFKY